MRRMFRRAAARAGVRFVVASLCFLAAPSEAWAQGSAGPDRDLDGREDAVDQCVAEPEDFDGFQDADGCPEPDNDSDGIPDVNDKCPGDPETVNGFADEDGCADDKVAALQLSPPKPPPAKAAGRKVAEGEQLQWVVAVMDVEVNGRQIPKTTRRALSDQIRIYLGQRRLKVIDRGAQEAALKGLVEEEKKRSYASCVDAACQIPLGKALAATHILRSSIASFDPTTCTTNGELIDLKTEVLVAAVSISGNCKPTELLRASEQLADQLIQESRDR